MADFLHANPHPMCTREAFLAKGADDEDAAYDNEVGAGSSEAPSEEMAAVNSLAEEFIDNLAGLCQSLSRQPCLALLIGWFVSEYVLMIP